MPWPASSKSPKSFRYLPGEQRQSFPFEAAKDDHVPRKQFSRWQVPDWIVVPGGNLGNSSAFGKAFDELYRFGLIDRIPRLAVINASGAGHFTNSTNGRGLRWEKGNGQHGNRRSLLWWFPTSRAARQTPSPSAIEINRPVNLRKCLCALEVCNGVVRQVSDQEILDAKAKVGLGGIGCEPAKGCQCGRCSSFANKASSPRATASSAF
ncbi:MAG: hypothetical protein U0894_19700 [Pirellulales bacterium]